MPAVSFTVYSGCYPANLPLACVLRSPTDSTNLAPPISGHLKETIIVQLIAFSFMCLLLVQFSGEFISKGFPHSLPLFGDSMSQLAGVVLFNYAYIVTVPSWLNEKQNGVSVNSTIWHASTLSSAIYFGAYRPSPAASKYLVVTQRW